MSGFESKSPNEDRIERLLRLAGPRPEVPVDRSERVYDAVRSQWRRTLRSRFRKRLTLWSGLAAAAALAGVLAVPGVTDRLVSVVEPVPEGPIARVETVSGAVRFGAGHVEASERGRLVMAGDWIRAGAVLETADRARVALRLESGPSVRLDVLSTARFTQPSAIDLENGSLYVDSGASGAQIEVRTPAGTVMDIGTQFEVRVRPQGVRVRVREGLVHLDRRGESHEATAGTELEVDPSGAVARRSVPTFGPLWDWVLEVSPPFTLEGSTLADFLAWVDRETGWEVAFEERRAEVSAPGVVLHGSLDGIRPDRALDAVLPPCGLTHRLEAGTLYIEALPQ